MGQLIDFQGTRPKLGTGVFLAPGSMVIGDVTIGDQSSVWFNTVIRGDVFPVHIGARCNVQDCSVIHVTTGKFSTVLEDDVTIGHKAILHGCTIRKCALVGMGAIIMDDAEIGSHSLVAAGAIVTPGTKIPEGVLAVGSPARVRRKLSDEEMASFADSAAHYTRLAAAYMGGES